MEVCCGLLHGRLSHLSINDSFKVMQLCDVMNKTEKMEYTESLPEDTVREDFFYLPAELSPARPHAVGSVLSSPTPLLPT